MIDKYDLDKIRKFNENYIKRRKCSFYATIILLFGGLTCIAIGVFLPVPEYKHPILIGILLIIISIALEISVNDIVKLSSLIVNIINGETNDFPDKIRKDMDDISKKRKTIINISIMTTAVLLILLYIDYIFIKADYRIVIISYIMATIGIGFAYTYRIGKSIKHVNEIVDYYENQKQNKHEPSSTD